MGFGFGEYLGGYLGLGAIGIIFFTSTSSLHQAPSDQDWYKYLILYQVQSNPVGTPLLAQLDERKRAQKVDRPYEEPWSIMAVSSHHSM